MNLWKVILATIVIFGAGVLTGGFITQRSLPAGLARPAASQESVGPNPWFVRKEYLHRLDQKLSLTAQQHERIAHILEDSQERTRSLLHPISPQMQAILREVRQKIRAELTADQMVKYDEMLQHVRPQHPGEPREDRRPGRRREAAEPPRAPAPASVTNSL